MGAAEATKAKRGQRAMESAHGSRWTYWPEPWEGSNRNEQQCGSQRVKQHLDQKGQGNQSLLAKAAASGSSSVRSSPEAQSNLGEQVR